MTNKDNNDYSFIFWVHLIINLIFVFSFLLFSWWLIIIGEIILQLQYIIMKGCVLSKAEFGHDEACIPYYLHKWKLIKDKHKNKIFVRYFLPVIVIILAIIFQIVLNIRPLIY
ncbi:MAG: hypothetical protein ACD_11C00017G0008 [uncultured bacterium]|nr:MAG: hypothetical protein ACD_11C00017G0008 [uncultured bacterium]HBR71497.1 hypothetical protein [Candidatus Moranbacteria bacterium]